MQVAFEREIMHTQYCVQNERLDFYLSEHKLGLETDEYCHVDRDFEYDQSRELMKWLQLDSNQEPLSS